MATSRGTEATVPVAVDVRGPAASRVLRVVEGVLGWPVVDPDDPVLPPRLVLVDARSAAGHAHRAAPLVLVVDEEDQVAAVARAGRHAAAVVDGIPDVALLRRLADELAAPISSGRPPWCTVVASAGGVGATTVATALAGLRAWRHGPTLLGVSGPAHDERAPTVAPSDLAGPAVWSAACSAVGVEDLRVVGLRGAGVPDDVGDVSLVVDLGAVETPADVLVVRPDRRGLTAVATAVARAVVLVGRGPVDAAHVRAAARGRLVCEVAWSARVAAAAAAQRMPTDLPGTWLRQLEPIHTLLGTEETMGAAGTAGSGGAA